jgi:hypothetical protein
MKVVKALSLSLGAIYLHKRQDNFLVLSILFGAFFICHLVFPENGL